MSILLILIAKGSAFSHVSPLYVTRVSQSVKLHVSLSVKATPVQSQNSAAKISSIRRFPSLSLPLIDMREDQALSSLDRASAGDTTESDNSQRCVD
jgi:hypothetical protein